MISSFLFQAAATLPLDAIRAHLDALPTVRRDRCDDAVYIVADDAATLQFVVDAREKSREGYPRVASLVRLFDDRIDFSVQTRDVDTVCAFARWLRGAYDVVILNEAFKDITVECDDNLDHLFGKPRKRRVAPVGFFRELKHGRADGPSLREAMRDKGKPGESRMATDPTPEVLAEVDNAELAAEEIARDGHTARCCLRCGGELILEPIGASYVVCCKHEKRVVLTSRGL